ncbi:MAG: hypothetical protein ACT443_09505 [Gemmatimonadota bacterium]
MRWLLLLFCFACAGTGPEPERACTLIGCENGLFVVLSGVQQQDVTVSVSSGGQVIHSFTCRAGQECRGFAMNQTPDQVTVRVTRNGEATSRDFTPAYRLNRPNGPDCPPVCKQATITI